MFKRGITNPKFIDALNQLYQDKNSFWKKMMDDAELFIAIRNNYINVYYKGQSICKLSFIWNKTIKGETHKKYVDQNYPKTYITSHNGIFQNIDTDLTLDQIDVLKRNAEEYCGIEKRHSYKQILASKKVLDVEITFSRNDDVCKMRSSVDFLEAKKTDDKVTLVFYEAKHISNSEIKSSSKCPKVFCQLKRYEAYIEHQKENIINSYRLVSKNLIDLNLADHYPLVKDIANESAEIIVEPSPILIIYGVPKDETMKNWSIHREKLENKLGAKLELIFE